MKVSSCWPMVAVFSCALSCYGATIVVMRTDDGILLAADSKVTRRGSNPPPRCKIHQYGKVFVAVASAGKNENTGPEMERIAGTAAAAKGPLQSKVDSFANVARKSLLADIESQKKSNPATFQQAYVGKRILDVTFASIEGPKPEAVVETFFVDGAGVLHDLPSPLAGHRLLVTGMSSAIKSYTDRNSGWYEQQGPEVAIKNFMELEIAMEKNAVGPPISILKLDGGVARWIEAGACPAIRK
jgi:hypothetical protein